MKKFYDIGSRSRFVVLSSKREDSTLSGSIGCPETAWLLIILLNRWDCSRKGGKERGRERGSKSMREKRKEGFDKRRMWKMRERVREERETQREREREEMGKIMWKMRERVREERERES